MKNPTVKSQRRDLIFRSCRHRFQIYSNIFSTCNRNYAKFAHFFLQSEMVYNLWSNFHFSHFSTKIIPSSPLNISNLWILLFLAICSFHVNFIPYNIFEKHMPQDAQFPLTLLRNIKIRYIYIFFISQTGFQCREESSFHDHRHKRFRNTLFIWVLSHEYRIGSFETLGASKIRLFSKYTHDPW